MKVEVSRSERVGKKWKAELPSGKTVHFGASGYQDFTQHGDAQRRESYLARHKPNQDWSKGGVGTAGFWARLAPPHLPIPDVPLPLFVLLIDPFLFV